MTAQPIKYTFGALQFSIKQKGVFFGCDKLRARIATLSLDEAREANRAAWKQRKSAVRIANLQNNVSEYGWNDARDQLIEVCEVVCRETWRRMQGAV